MPGGHHTRRFRKRTFVVTGISLLCVMLAGGIIIFLATLNLGPSDLVRISISEGSNRNVILGSGVSLSDLKTANLIQDPSFEPYIFRQALTVYHGDETTIIVSSEDAAAGYFGDGFFDGAEARIMTWTDEGMALKKTARVRNYGINRVGVFGQVILPGDIPLNSVINDFAYRNDMTVAVGDNGLIVRNAGGQTPDVVDTGLRSDLTGISSHASGFVACSSEGDVLFSDDGIDWIITDFLAGNSLTAIAASDDELFVAIDDSGNIFTGSRKTQTKAYYKSNNTLNDIIYSQGMFIAVGNRGTILTSRNGLIWQKYNVNSGTDWLAADTRDERIIITGENGKIVICNEDKQFSLLDAEQEVDFVDIIMISHQQFIALDPDGRFFISNDGGYIWQKSNIDPGMHSRIIAVAGKDRIISADAQGSIGLSQLAAEIVLDTPLREGQYQAGDLVYLEQVVVEIPESLMGYGREGLASPDFWEYNGPGIFTRTMDDSAPTGGLSALQIDRSDNTQAAAIISQKIGNRQEINIAANEIFEIEIWLRHEGSGEHEVQAWLSGHFPAVGTTITHIGSTWRKYNYAFVFPSSSVRDEAPIYFNIAYKGKGRLWIDRVFLGSASEPQNEATTGETQIMRSIQPAAMRMDFLNIGQKTGGVEDWSLPLSNESISFQENGWHSRPGHSLHAGLQLAYSSKSDPWLILDSYISESEMIYLVEFLSAPISEHYGRLRQQNGSVVPWTDQFSRIYLEFIDSGDILQNDRNRANFVDLMIRTAGRSPYYQQIKSQLIFVDGMPYDEGVMLSRADYHAADLTGFILYDGRTAIDQAYTEFYDQVPRNLEKPALSWTELIRSANLNSNGNSRPSLADLTYLLLADLGRQSSLANLSLPGRQSSRWNETWPSAASIAAKGAKGEPLLISLYSSGEEILDPDEQKLGTFGFRSETQTSVILTNQSNEMITCELLTDINLRGAEIAQYDSEGLLLSRQTFRRQESRINLLPGGVTIIVKEENTP